MSGQRVLVSDATTTQTWLVERLWRLSTGLVVEQVPVKTFDWHFDSRCWFGPDGLTVRELAELVRATMQADSSYPVILAAEGWIMDGRKRLCRALVEGRESVPVVRFEVAPEPDETAPVGSMTTM